MKIRETQLTATIVAFFVSTLIPSTAAAAIRYVDVNSANPTPPYTNWATAANVIQDAVDVAVPGEEVVVTNGTYAAGGRMWFDSGVNRVTITNTITLRSVNGPAFTFIQGFHAPGTNAVRCLLLTTTVFISGFTLTNGQSGAGNYPNGGGVFCYSSSAVISNCVLVGNLANYSGGGAYQGTFKNCTFRGNSAVSDVGGGGAFKATLINCILAGNSSQKSCGGMYGGTAINCLIVSNTAGLYGGGASGGTWGATLTNCTLVGNAATNWGGGVDGGSGARLFNCICYYNWAPINPDTSGVKAAYCCSMPQFLGDSNITNPPSFVNLIGGDFRLQADSPCINAGNNMHVSTSVDLDGRPRVVSGTVDMGAYEHQGSDTEGFISWLWQFGLPTDGSADFADTDVDGLNNWQEWRADTSPTNALSRLALLSPTNTPTGVAVSWQSAPTRSYFLERGANVAEGAVFQTIATNITGLDGTTTFTDTAATNGSSFFYRVGVLE